MLVLFLITGCYKENSVVNSETPIFIPNPLCFTVEESGVTIMMGITSNDQSYDNRNLEYSFDKTNWEEFRIGITTITLDSVGDKVYFRGENPNGLNPSWSSGEEVYFITNDKKVSASGNVMSLIDPKCESKTVPEYCFIKLFKNTTITTAPELPATTLANHCYDELFFFCNNLSSIKVFFNDWNSPIGYWVTNVSPSGIFYCSSKLPQIFGDCYIPEGWTVETF